MSDHVISGNNSHRSSGGMTHESRDVILYVGVAMMSSAGLTTLYPAEFVVAIGGLFALIGLLVESYQRTVNDNDE